jgi:hypothetical protein
VPSAAAPGPASKENVTLAFEVPQAVPFGQRVAVVGSSPELGAWTEPVPLAWAEGDVWTGRVEGCVFFFGVRVFFSGGVFVSLTDLSGRDRGLRCP